MCLPLMGLAASAIGAGVQAYGTYKTVDAENQAAKFNSRIQMDNAKSTLAAADTARLNADIASYNAASQRKEAAAIGRVEERKLMEAGAQFQGQQAAQMSASGAVVNSGTFANVATDTAVGITTDAISLRHQTAQQQYAISMDEYNARQQFLAQESDLRGQARNMVQLAQFTGAQWNPWVPTATSLIGSATQIGSQQGWFAPKKRTSYASMVS